jgi:hypothetical protein
LKSATSVFGDRLTGHAARAPGVVVVVWLVAAAAVHHPGGAARVFSIEQERNSIFV